MNEFHESTDGYLFLTGGHHDVAAYMLGQKTPGPDSVESFLQNQRTRLAWCRDRGVSYGTWVFPDKLYALRGKVPELGPLNSLFLSRYRSAPGWDLDTSVHYPIGIFEDAPQMFTFGDTHYSPRGEISVTQAILDDIAEGFGKAFSNEAMPRLTQRKKQLGDLSKKLSEPRPEKIKTLDAPLVPYDVVKNGVPGNNGTLILIDSPEARRNETLLIFGDSFFRTMLGYFAWAYRRIVFCRSQFFHYEIARAVRPNVILGGMAERYLADCLPDSRRPHFLSYTLLAGRPMKPEPGFAELYARYFDQTELVGP